MTCCFRKYDFRDVILLRILSHLIIMISTGTRNFLAFNSLNSEVKIAKLNVNVHYVTAKCYTESLFNSCMR